jgi:DNA-binding phage protein
MSKNKTAFDRYHEKRMKSPEYAETFKREHAYTKVVDRLVNELDEIRDKLGLSKAELARKIGANPSIARRLFSTEQPNPTLSTMVKVLHAMGYELKIVPQASKGTRKASTKKKRSLSQDTARAA